MLIFVIHDVKNLHRLILLQITDERALIDGKIPKTLSINKFSDLADQKVFKGGNVVFIAPGKSGLYIDSNSCDNMKSHSDLAASFDLDLHSFAYCLCKPHELIEVIIHSLSSS